MNRFYKRSEIVNILDIPISERTNNGRAIAVMSLGIRNTIIREYRRVSKNLSFSLIAMQKIDHCEVLANRVQSVPVYTYAPPTHLVHA